MGLQGRSYPSDFEEDHPLTDEYSNHSFPLTDHPKGNHQPSYFKKNSAYHDPNYQNRGQFGGKEQFTNERMGNLNRAANSLNSEQGIRFEISRLQQEEFALSQTIKALEERYDAGYITSAEFMKSYREMQKEIYNTQSQIAQFQKYLDETYGLINN
jgi:spore coat protein CotH